MKTLGGSFFIYQGVDLDFCFEATVACCLELCDQVVVMDCGSTDGTKEKLDEIASKNPKMTVIDGDWHKDMSAQKFEDLSREVISELKTDWHIHIQADEVLHEDCFWRVRKIIEVPGIDAYSVRRINLWRDKDTCIRFDSPVKPFADAGIRIARMSACNRMDGNSDDNLKVDGVVCNSHIDLLPLYHYGLIRDRMKLARKVIDVQKGHFGAADGRLQEAVKTGEFKHSSFGWDNFTMPIPGTHPKFVKEWLSVH